MEHDHDDRDYNQVVGEREVEGRDRVIATSQTFKVMAMVIEMAIVVILLATMLVMPLIDFHHMIRFHLFYVETVNILLLQLIHMLELTNYMMMILLINMEIKLKEFFQ